MSRPKGAKNKAKKPRVNINSIPEAVKNKLTCSICGQLKNNREFYASFNPLHGTGKVPYCTKCIKDKCTSKNGEINLTNLKTILKEIDKPFLYDLLKSAFDESKNDEGTVAYDVIGLYFKNICSLKQFQHLGYSNSVFEPNFEKVVSKELNWDKLEKEDDFILTDEIEEFFGYGFADEEYKAMHKKYHFLKNNYPEKTNMHIEALKTYVRYKVKEEMATAAGDVGSASKWAELANKAATNAKINPSQLTKADLTDGLSTFSELSQALEREVDIIPILPKFKCRPNDALDFNIWCYVNYIRDLKGLPPCKYEEVYGFYDKRKAEYVAQYGDPYGIFSDDTSDKNRENIKKFIDEEGG